VEKKKSPKKAAEKHAEKAKWASLKDVTHANPKKSMLSQPVATH
jgi:hypothetical protein